MTLPSRKKHPTTAPNTSPAKPINLAALRGWNTCGWKSLGNWSRLCTAVALGGLLFATQTFAADDGDEGRLKWTPNRPVNRASEEPTPAVPTSAPAARSADVAGSRNSTIPAYSAAQTSSRRVRPDMPRGDGQVRTVSDTSSEAPSAINDPFGDRARKPSRYVQQAVQLESRPSGPERVQARTVDTDLQLRGLDDEPGLAPRTTPPASGGNDANPFDTPRQPNRLPTPEQGNQNTQPRFAPREAAPGGLTPREPAPRTELDSPSPSTRPNPSVEPKASDKAADNKAADTKKICAEARKDCADEFRRLKDHTLDQVSLDISVDASLKELKVPTSKQGEDFPCECVLGNEEFQGRNWACTNFTWKASALCHKPLYFEQVAMERYGQSWGPFIDPVMSGLNFFGSFIFLPYKMGLETPDECVYALGYYRPGNCAPYYIDAIPWSPRGALFQAGAVAGIAYAIP